MTHVNHLLKTIENSSPNGWIMNFKGLTLHNQTSSEVNGRK